MVNTLLLGGHLFKLDAYKSENCYIWAKIEQKCFIWQFFTAFTALFVTSKWFDTN